MNYRTSIGLDVHARSIRAAAFIPETGEIIERGFGYDAEAIAEWAAALPQPVGAVYESGPTGFDLCRSLGALGVECRVGAVSKMLRPSGDKVKTDRRDATFLARMLAVGNVVEVIPPTPEMEAYRDLARARADARGDLMRCRHRLSKMLLRKGIAYEAGKSAWTKAHREWLSSICFGDPVEKAVFDEYLDSVVAAERKRDRLDALIGSCAEEEAMSPSVAALSSLRGVGTVSAFSLKAEIGDFSRFPDARSFMSYLGLVPSERSSGEATSRGRITRTGNLHARTLLVEAAWHQARAYKPLVSSAGAVDPAVAPEVAACARRANRRLHERAMHLRNRGVSPGKANIAVAREMAGFVWALGRMAQK